MTKISPWAIFTAHFATLRDYRTGRLSLADISLFFLVPVLIGAILLYRNELVSGDFYKESASVFGIFAALLLNVEVAIFGIFLRRWDRPDDPATLSVLHDRESKRRTVLKELNANLSYIIFICCLGIGLCMLFFGLETNKPVYTAAVAAIYVHILLSVMMASKRAFLLFDAEYQR